MNCQELQDHYELYALGLAEDPERSEIRAHLNRKCEVCMPGVKRALEATALLGTTVSDASPSGKLRDRILASVGAEPRRFSLTPFFALVTAMSIGVTVYVANQSRNAAKDASEERRAMTQQLHDAQQETSRLTAAFSILNGPETTSAGSG